MVGDLLKYKGYFGRVALDTDAGVLHGRVVNTRDVITFEADNVKDLEKEFHNSVNDYLEFCEERGEEPDKPYSGKLSLRIPPQLHQWYATAAAARAQSINKMLEHCLRLVATAEGYDEPDEDATEEALRLFSGSTLLGVRAQSQIRRRAATTKTARAAKVRA